MSRTHNTVKCHTGDTPQNGYTNIEKTCIRASVRFYQIYVNWWSHLNPIHLESLLFSHKYLWKIDKNDDDTDEKPKFNTSEDFSYKCSYFTFTQSCWWQHPWVKFFAHFYLRSFFTPTVYTQTPDDDMFLICKWHDKVRRKNNENLTWLPWLRNNTQLTITCCSSRSYISYVQATFFANYTIVHTWSYLCHYVKQTSEIR